MSGSQDLAAALLRLGRHGPADLRHSPACPSPAARWAGANPEPAPRTDAPHRQPHLGKGGEPHAAPSLEELQRQVEEGGCEATDGCASEPDGYCEHDQPSWLLARA